MTKGKSLSFVSCRTLSVCRTAFSNFWLGDSWPPRLSFKKSGDSYDRSGTGLWMYRVARRRILPLDFSSTGVFAVDRTLLLYIQYIDICERVCECVCMCACACDLRCATSIVAAKSFFVTFFFAFGKIIMMMMMMFY